ncbi:CocE/NonD family hydrolase [Argonema galeatum]|uniref:CocE/NonD family hydrolase n=1 Tax=Argonema galeatum TaxID=2942762 RepID=UPI0020136A25|nr:CocE/NonD family hydrolase [Argonema galeatum]MCL1466663.1 CocE/NonD family hydrolase [Argonema galeatum A003/A1]
MIKETVSMFTRDGVRLDADIYRPDAEGTFPVLLMRQPYGKAIASTVVYAHPSWYASHGYITVIQDVRGRGTSAGEFKLFNHEIADGFDAVNWAAQLPGSSGEVGMYGFSYQGMTQLYAASAHPPALKTICPAMIGYDLYTDWAYQGGAFCLQDNLSWAIQLAAETARLRNDEKAYQALYAAYRNLPLSDTIPASPEILKKLAPDSFYHEWLNHPKPDEYWEKLSPKQYFQEVDLPILHIGGWFDTYLRGTLHLYKEMAYRSDFLQYLLIGPWAHLPWGRKVGAVDYGSAAASPIDKLQIRWFDQFLKGKDTGLLKELPVCLFEMGSNLWRSFESWPNNNHISYFLSSSGLASSQDDAGKLVAHLPTPSLLEGEGEKEGENPKSPIPNPQSEDILVHDPWRPVPALGGHASFPAGSFERSAIDSRTDVLTYTSAPLTEDLHIAGDVSVEIYCTGDRLSFDLCAVLSEVQNNDKVYNFTQGYVRVEPNQETTPLKISLQSTCVRIAKGDRLRLSLSAACFPAYPVNPGTGSLPGETRLIESQIITLTVRSGGNFPSQILLPFCMKGKICLEAIALLI